MVTRGRGMRGEGIGREVVKRYKLPSTGRGSTRDVMCDYNMLTRANTAVYSR